jgi:two-component system nitrogen regulation response regulator NtrX
LSRILIVDDEEGIRRSLAGILGDEGFETSAAEDGPQALRSLDEEGAPDLVLLDIAMPGPDGVEVLVSIKERFPALPVVMMSGHGTIETAVRTTRHGAYDFIEKPLSIDKVLLTLQHALDQASLERENRLLRAQSLRAPEILGESKGIVHLKEQINVAAPTNGWVLVTGENGTGKELVARQIHLQSRRSDGPFVEVNCAAIPEELIESELFGHEKGAFTGAVARKRGKFELAHGGTIFLDEIADMSLMTQAKVLRILEEQSFERVGGTQTLDVDVRVVAATNKNLEQEMQEGRFREDLYYRLNVIPFHVPPLRERLEDLPVLAETFVAQFCAESAMKVKKLSPAALKRLGAHSWPGNVRELRNLMERLVIMSPGPNIGVADLPDDLGRVEVAASAAASLEDARRDFERDFLVTRLREHDWNISRTAEAVGLARESLSRKIKAHGIEVERG